MPEVTTLILFFYAIGSLFTLGFLQKELGEIARETEMIWPIIFVGVWVIMIWPVVLGNQIARKGD